MNVLRIAFCYRRQAADLSVSNFTLLISSHNHSTQARSNYTAKVSVKTTPKREGENTNFTDNLHERQPTRTNYCGRMQNEP